MSLSLSSPWTRLVRGIRHRTGRFFNAAERLLLPPRCTFCNLDFYPADELYLCGDCRKILISPLGNICRRCAAVVPISHPFASSDCIHCSAHPWHLKKVVALGHYHDDLRAAVLRTKLVAEEPLTRTLGHLLFSERREALAELKPDVIVPIPMHWTRRISRGVNGAEIIGRQLSQGLRVKLEPGVLRRIRRTQKHGYISRHKRYENMHGALAVSSAFEVTDAHILLVDDILTTGVTANEAAKVLRNAGASHVSVAIIARAEGEH